MKLGQLDITVWCYMFIHCVALVTYSFLLGFPTRSAEVGSSVAEANIRWLDRSSEHHLFRVRLILNGVGLRRREFARRDACRYRLVLAEVLVANIVELLILVIPIRCAV